MKTIFEVLCGILYLIGIPFGWSYETTSIYICIYLWPILCCISTFPILFSSIRFFFKKKLLIGSILTLLSTFYTYIYICFTLIILDRYSISDSYSFYNCMIDLKIIAEYYNISYEALNIIIYVFGFLIIQIFNFLLFKIINYKYKSIVNT